MNDIQKAERLLASPLMRKFFPILILLLYVAGMVVMIFVNFTHGLTLWFISTVLGALLLYVKRTQEKKIRDLQEEEAQESALRKSSQDRESN